MIHKIEIPTPFAVGDVNAFVVKGDALSLVDAGPKTPEAYEALKRGLNEIGYTFNDIEQVILTHHHPDHAGWMDAFDKAELIGHPYNDLWLKRDQSFMEYHDRFYLQCLKRRRRAGKLFQLGGKDEAANTIDGGQNARSDNWGRRRVVGASRMDCHGNTWTRQSHIVLFNEKTGEMIGGDLVLEKVSSNPLIEPPANREAARPKSLLQYNASLTRLLDLPIDVVYGGHGNEVRNIRPLIESRLQKQRERAMKVHAMLNEGSKTIYELTQQLFPTVYERELGLTLSETIGQTDYLLSKGLVRETVGGRRYFVL